MSYLSLCGREWSGVGAYSNKYGNYVAGSRRIGHRNLPNSRRTGERSLSSLNMASKGNSVFSRIIRRELPASFLHEDDQVDQERCVTQTLTLQ